MAPRPAYLSEHLLALSEPAAPAPAPAPARDHLVLVPSDPILLTFADAVELRGTGPLWRRQRRRFPAGRLHAAKPGSEVALCGMPLDSLEAFGRSRHPFERCEVEERCPRCHVVAGRPVA
jgi:hypothetical protein